MTSTWDARTSITLPCATTVLAVFTHEQEGPAAVAKLFRGLFRGLYSFVVFCVVVAATLESMGLAASFGIALIAGLAVHAVGYLHMRAS